MWMRQMKKTATKEEAMARASKDKADVAQQDAFPLPPGYENESPGFARAYAYAKGKGNLDKAALQCAEAWQEDFAQPEDVV
jgi:hypothetical protein